MDGMTINHIVSIDHGSYEYHLDGKLYHYPIMIYIIYISHGLKLVGFHQHVI